MSTGRSPFAVVLGTAQDAGLPQVGCRCGQCEAARREPSLRRRAACVALVDPADRARVLIDVTPDLGSQLEDLDRAAGPAGGRAPIDAAFLTHAHVGHYTGLTSFGREAMATKGVVVYGTSSMGRFLRENAPWDALLAWGHVRFLELGAAMVSISSSMRVRPVAVPHRAEYTDTVGYEVEGPTRRLLYVPDIDGWDSFVPPGGGSTLEYLDGFDVLVLDGTFFSDDELPTRDLAEIPHPRIQESMVRFAALGSRVVFTHLNHSNPVAMRDSDARRSLDRHGFRVADERMIVPL